MLKQQYGTGSPYCRKVYDSLHGARYVRLLHDVVPESGTLVFEYSSNHLLYLVEERNLSSALKKSMLRDTLRGIAELHDKNYVHTGMEVRICSLAC